VFSDAFIRRPILATVCSLVIILAGAICIPTLPIARYPQLAPPSVAVTAFYTGANAQAVESAVTTPLEQVINGVEGMTYMQSSSTNSGVSTINVYFDIGRDPDLAAVDVQNRVNQTLGRLPADVRTTGVTVTKQSAGFLGGLGFFSKGNRYTSQFISNYLDLYVRDAIKRVPGVGNVIIFGERKYAMRVWLDPARLAARGITASDVVNALREQNLQVAAGALGDAPADDSQAYTLSVRALGRLTEPSQFDNVVVKAGNGAALVRVRDVGRVELGAETYSANLRFIGLEASGMGIQLLPSANALEVYQGVMKEMARLEKAFPPGLEWRLAFDNVGGRPRVDQGSAGHPQRGHRPRHPRDVPVPAELAQHAHPRHHHPGVPGGHLHLRQALRVLHQHPDPVRDRARHRDRRGRRDRRDREHRAPHARGEEELLPGGPRRHARGVRRGGGDRARARGRVRARGLLPGTTGRLYQQFSLTIAFAVVLSVFNAVTFTPALSALLLAKQTHVHGRFFAGVNRVIDRGTHGYVRVLRRALVLRPLMLGLFALGLLGTWWLFKTVPSAFVPDEDEGYFISIIQAPAGASLGYTTDIAKQAEAIIFKDPDIAAAFSVVGFSFSGAAPNNGLIFTRLKDYSERKGKSHSLAAVLGRVRAR
jgi:multidrug efflux pump subunit AcrB